LKGADGLWVQTRCDAGVDGNHLGIVSHIISAECWQAVALGTLEDHACITQAIVAIVPAKTGISSGDNRVKIACLLVGCAGGSGDKEKVEEERRARP